MMQNNMFNPNEKMSSENTASTQKKTIITQKMNLGKYRTDDAKLAYDDSGIKVILRLAISRVKLPFRLAFRRIHVITLKSINKGRAGSHRRYVL